MKPPITTKRFVVCFACKGYKKIRTMHGHTNCWHCEKTGISPCPPSEIQSSGRSEIYYSTGRPQ